MKMKNVFTLSLVALLLLSCSKESDTIGKEPGKSKLTVSLKGEKSASGDAQASAISSRAAGKPNEGTAGESKINDFIIYVFRANGAKDIAPKAVTVNTDADLTVKDYEITNDATEIIVLANTNKTTSLQTELMKVTTRGGLETIVGRMFADNNKTTLSSQTSTNLWMSGAQDIIPHEAGKITATVTMKYVPARVRITKVTIDDTQITDLSAKLKLNEITVFNAGGATKLIPTGAGTSLIPSFTASASTPFYYSGLDMNGMSEKPVTYSVNDSYTLPLTGDPAKIDLSTDKNPNYFYVFENDGAAGHFEAQPTIITLKATYDGTRVIYYSYLFKADVTGDLGFDNVTIERGKSYDITMTIKRLGASDPVIPSIPTTVEIAIKSASWKTETVEKVFQ